MDIKTGANLSYSWQSIAIQLAVYAGAETIYNPATCTHEPMPAVDQARALVIHLLPGEASATPYWINLEAGRKGIALTSKIMEWRNGKGLATEATAAAVVIPPPDDPPEPPTPNIPHDRTANDVIGAAFPGAVEVAPSSFVASVDLRAYVVARMRAIIDAGHGADLAKRWPDEVPTLKSCDAHTEAQLDEILQACVVVDGLHGMPFPSLDDPRVPF
jgi:hypothetical protein